MPYTYDFKLNVPSDDEVIKDSTAKIRDAKAAVLERINSFCPVGAIAPHMTETVPYGWLECDGSAVSRSTFATLFASISTTFGIGNGTTTFNIPDLRGYFPRAKANGGGVAKDTGSRIVHADLTAGSTTIVFKHNIVANGSAHTSYGDYIFGDGIPLNTTWVSASGSNWVLSKPATKSVTDAVIVIAVRRTSGYCGWMQLHVTCAASSDILTNIHVPASTGSENVPVARLLRIGAYSQTFGKYVTEILSPTSVRMSANLGLTGEYTAEFTNDAIGTKQVDGIINHTHSAYVIGGSAVWGHLGATMGTAPATTGAYGAGDVRPKNVAAMYIIRALPL